MPRWSVSPCPAGASPYAGSQPGAKRPARARYSRSPKIARPTRTIVAPSSIATSKSSVMPMDSADQSAPGKRRASSSRSHRVARKHGRDSAEYKDAMTKQRAIDEDNIRRLEEIIAHYGWPGKTQFGDKAARTAFLILQHSDLNYQKKYLPLAREAAARGELPASQLALLEDRVRLNAAMRTFLWIVHVAQGARESVEARFRGVAPPAGSIIVADAGTERWEAVAPNLHAADAANDGRALRWMIVAGGQCYRANALTAHGYYIAALR